MTVLSKSIKNRVLALGSVYVFSAFAAVAHAYDTSTIPDHPTSTISLQSNQTYDFGGRTIYGDKVGSDNLFKCHGKQDVTLKNVKIKDVKKFGIWVKGCKDLTITKVDLQNAKAGGIRFEKGTSNSKVELSNIKGKKLGGHGIELWDVDGFNISGIQMNDTDKCGVLVNRSKNGKVGTVKGSNNDSDGGYATLRFANNAGPNISVSKVESKNSGRGFFTVSGSRGITVNTVSIDRARAEGIYLQGGSNNQVKGGRSRGKPNCRIRDSSGSSIKADCGGSVAK